MDLELVRHSSTPSLLATILERAQPRGDVGVNLVWWATNQRLIVIADSQSMTVFVSTVSSPANYGGFGFMAGINLRMGISKSGTVCEFFFEFQKLKTYL